VFGSAATGSALVVCRETNSAKDTKEVRPKRKSKPATEPS